MLFFCVLQKPTLSGAMVKERIINAPELQGKGKDH